jgi:hypothetical protein
MFIAAFASAAGLVTGIGLEANGADSEIGGIHRSGSAALLDPAVPDCANNDLVGPWLIVISGVEAYDYAVYMVFDGLGTIDEMGSFNVPDSAGEYSVQPDCEMTGYIWSDGYIPFTGRVLTDSTAEFDGESGPTPLLKVRDVSFLEGCWQGEFVQDTTHVTYNVEFQIDESGSIESSIGFTPPVSGKLFFESGHLAGFINTGESAGWSSIMLLDTAMPDNSTMTGTFGIDCDGCPLGNFTLQRCVNAVTDRISVRSPVLYQNYPNPFGPQTRIGFDLPGPSHVQVVILDVRGRMVKTLVEGRMPAGRHSVTWDGRDRAGHAVPPGVYLYRIQAGEFTDTKKALFLQR